MVRHTDILFKTHAVDAAKIADSYVSSNDAAAINWIGTKVEKAYTNGQYKTDPLIITNINNTILNYFIDDLGYRVENRVVDDIFAEAHNDSERYKVEESIGHPDRYNMIILHFEDEFASPEDHSFKIHTPNCYLAESDSDKRCIRTDRPFSECNDCILSKYNTGVD